MIHGCMSDLQEAEEKKMRNYNLLVAPRNHQGFVLKVFLKDVLYKVLHEKGIIVSWMFFDVVIGFLIPRLFGFNVLLCCNNNC